MAAVTPPAVIGEWYQDVVENQYFEVVAVDSLSGTIEIQYLDGEVSEIDQEVWPEMILQPAPPPEDASAAFEMSMPDDNWNSDFTAANSWNNPLSQIEPDLFQGSEDF